jgi:hypothetical protein
MGSRAPACRQSVRARAGPNLGTLKTICFQGRGGNVSTDVTAERYMVLRGAERGAFRFHSVGIEYLTILR